MKPEPDALWSIMQDLLLCHTPEIKKYPTLRTASLRLQNLGKERGVFLSQEREEGFSCVRAGSSLGSWDVRRWGCGAGSGAPAGPDRALAWVSRALQGALASHTCCFVTAGSSNLFL